MCKSIAFLSGKGGSGKTTLALSIASLLSRCNIKVLLIDCDLSTNGATYFYEGKLSQRKREITSFYDILFENVLKIKAVEIEQYYFFVPSITQITKKNTRTYSYRQDNKFSAYNELCNNYDVILFDCQAGYTDILKLILPISDINLVVMEADAISSASMRSLYLKIGDIINDRKIYQVFNKASQEEYEIYSKVYGGTVFTNVETIKFDWKIRKAFSTAQIPDMENTSALYGKQIYDLCIFLFSDEALKSKLKKFETILDIHFAKESEADIISNISSLRKNYTTTKSKTKRLVLYSMCTMIMILFLVYYSLSYNSSISTPLLFGVATGIALFISYISILDITKETRLFYKELETKQDQLDEIKVKEKSLKDSLEKFEKKDFSKRVVVRKKH